MTETSSMPADHARDREATLQNRANLEANHNLLHWYRELYREHFEALPDSENVKILEIGSGVSPLKRFYPNILTSDVLDLDYLDYVFDCHDIDTFEPVADESLNVIALTNVLHHLKDPIEFLNKAARKLRRGGKIIATEPYFSKLSTLIFVHLHHEPVDFDITEPVLPEIKSPLGSANIALPWLIFLRHPRWRDRLRANYEFDERNAQPFSSISYMATGGISRRLPVPRSIYYPLFRIDMILSRAFPKLLASFFTVTLTRK